MSRNRRQLIGLALVIWIMGEVIAYNAEALHARAEAFKAWSASIQPPR